MKRAVFLDRDGTITKSDGYFYKREQLDLADNLADVINILNRNFLVIIITNQPVIARGLCTEEDVKRLHDKIVGNLAQGGARIDAIYFCPHHPEMHEDVPKHARKYRIDCNCRKPKTGLLEQAAADFDIDLASSFFIGDSTRDIETARRAGCVSILVKTGQRGEDGKYDSEPDYTCGDITDAANLIEKIKDMQAVILVGGRGERLRPLTDSTPKPMLPINGKPLLERQISLLKRYGISNIIICGHYMFEKIIEHFGDGKRFGVDITYVDEQQPLGTGGALKHAEPYIKSDDFLLFNGDIATNIRVPKLVQFHMENRSLVTLVLRVSDHIYDSDAIEIGEDGRVIRFVGREQEQVKTANTGIMMFSKDFLNFMQSGFSSLEKGNIARLIGRERIYGYLCSDYFKDIGTIEKYEKAKEELVL